MKCALPRNWGGAGDESWGGFELVIVGSALWRVAWKSVGWMGLRWRVARADRDA